MNPATVFGFEAMGIAAAIAIAFAVLQLGVGVVFDILRSIFWPSVSQQTIDRHKVYRRR
jgi:hypothetical protein